MSNIALTVEQINQLAPLDIVTNDIVRQRFIQIYDTLWGNGEAAYERESNFFSRILRDDEKLQKSTRFSIFTSFIDLAVSGLSLEPGARALCYLMGRNHKTSEVKRDSSGKPMTDKYGNPIYIYEGRMVLTVSGYGELVMRARSGQIRHADNPVLVYAEDNFSFGETDGRKVLNYTCNLPHKSNQIVACYMKITRADGTIDYAVMYEESWKRLEGFSERNNRRYVNGQWVGKANELYNSNGGSIDPGFLMAKCIKHAFKTYPKVRIGKYTAMESDQIDNAQAQKEIDDFYGVTEPATEQPAMPHDDNPPFGPAEDMSAGVTINPANDAIGDDGTF